MKTIKTLLAVSALTTAASAAHATTWAVTMNSQGYFGGVNGDLVFENFAGVWDDLTGQGWWSGRVYTAASSRTYSPGVSPFDFSFTQTFFMPTTTGLDAYGYQIQGSLNPFDIASCVDHLNTVPNTCSGFSGVLQGEFYNTVPGNADGYNYNNIALWDPLAFVPEAETTYIWTLQKMPCCSHVLAYYPIPMSVTLHAVPLPTTAWLLGSSLIGLMGASRRRAAK